MSKKDHEPIIQDLNKNLDRINEWIKNCDSKASIMIAVIGLFFTLLLNDSILTLAQHIITFVFSNTHIFKIIYGIAIIIFLLCLILGLTFLFFTLNPILNLDLKKENLDSSNSVYYFGSIANMSFSEYSRLSSQASKNPEIQIESLKQQIFINSHIATKKYQSFKKGLYFSFLGLLGLIIFVLLGAVLVMDQMEHLVKTFNFLTYQTKLLLDSILHNLFLLFKTIF